MPTLFLPDAEGDLAEVCTRLITDAKAEQRIASVEWWITRHYLKGCRVFDNIDYDRGIVVPNYKNSYTGVPFKYEEMNAKRTTEIGRLMRLDTSPAVVRQNVGLDGLRRESVSQAVLDAINPYLNPEPKKRAFIEMLVDYGCAGMLAYELPPDETDKVNKAASVSTEVIPPWELLFLPASAKSPQEVCGVARRRWVSLKWLKDVNFAGATLKHLDNDKDPDLQVMELPQGSTVTADQDIIPPTSPGVTATRSSQDDRVKGKTPKMDKFVPLTEIWFQYGNGRLSRYIVMVGKKVGRDKDYKNTDGGPCMPLGVAILGEGIGLYGRGFIPLLIPLNIEVEAAMLNMLREVQNIRVLGVTILPMSLGVDQSDLQGLGTDGRRFVLADRDAMRPSEEPVQLSPVLSGDLPEKVINIGLGMLDRLGQQPEIVTQGRPPGRVDSKVGMEFLYQASTLPLGQIASSIATAYGTVYKALLGYAKKWKSVVLNLATMKDDSVIGIQLDPSSGSLELSKNALPDPLKLELGIKSQKPVDVDARKAELYELQSRQGISWVEFKITARLENLEVPLRDDVVWQNYRMAILRNIVLFNDGESPGDINEMLPGLQPSEYDIPEIHLMVVHRLMASPEFALASKAVQDAFDRLVQQYQDQAGRQPEELGYPEDEAEMADMAARGQAPEGLAGQVGLQPGGGAGAMGTQEQLQAALQSVAGNAAAPAPARTQ